MRMDLNEPTPDTTAWRSTAESIPTDDALRAEVDLERRDASFADSVRDELGRGGEPVTGPTTPFRRIGPAIAWRARRRLGPALVLGRKVGRRAGREVWRRVPNRVWSPRGGRTPDGVEIVPFPADAAGGNAILDTSPARFLIFVRPGASLLNTGLDALEKAIAEDSEAEVLYGDGRLPSGVRFRAPAHSPVRLREEDYLGPIVAISTAALRARGGFRPEADGAQVLDVVLAVEPARVRRLRAELGVGEPFATPTEEAAEAAARVVRDHLAAAGIDAEVALRGSGRRSVHYRVRGEPLVSIIIPTRGGSGAVAGVERTFVTEVVRAILERSTWPSYELVIVADDPTPQDVIDELEQLAGERLRLVRWSEPFNFSRKVNRGAVVARGEYLLALNDDVEPINPDWIEAMLSVAQLEGVGEVGALLFFEDGSVQHLGHFYHHGNPGHVAFGVMPGALTPLDSLLTTRQVSGVTGACALMPRQLFEEVGGFSTRFAGNYNDVDLSLKVRRTGRTILCTGNARLYHFESRTRDATVHAHELEELHSRWHDMIQLDEFERLHER